MISTARQIRLLVWKNFKIQFRRKIGTVVEVLLPILFFGLLIGLKTTLPDESFSEFIPNGTVALDSLPLNDSYTIIYSPNTGQVNSLMQATATRLNLNATGFATAEQIDAAGTGSQTIIGVVFDSTDGSLNGDLSYTLRFPPDPECFSCKDENQPGKFWATDRVFDKGFFDKGPIFKNVDENHYAGTGFLRVQYEIAKSFTGLQFNGDPAADNNVFTQFASAIATFPYKAYTTNRFATVGIQFTLPLIFILAFLYTFLVLVKEIVLEKELRLKESMKMMGLSTFANWMGWFIKHLAFLVPIIIVCQILLYLGKVFQNASPAIVFIFFLLYVLNFIMFGFFISSMFSNSKIAAAAAGVIFFVTYVPFFFLQRDFESIGVGVKALLCLLPNTCLAEGVYVIGTFESEGFKLNFKNIGTPATPFNNLSMGIVLVMLIFDLFIYTLLTWYIENVFPGEFGIARPWYFFVTPSYWRPNKKAKNSSLGNKDVNGETDGRFVHEEEPYDLHAGVRIEHLRKVYDNGKVAVQDLSLNMYEDQITCLLGHNGAGKTTTMSMLTGLYEPTEGTAYVNDYDIRTDMGKCRESLGLCPQVNTLFSALTVSEHLDFFGTLKGIKKKDMKENIKSILEELEMPDKKNNFPSGLSGGMKRKLCVGIAFLGGSKVVFLDEPTSGMDPGARRATWDIINNNKKGRSICLTTHFLDEADILGNRIAIMAEGQLQACGSSLFLKNQYGVGYQLVIVKRTDCDVATLQNVVLKFVPSASLLANAGAEISFRLPTEHTGAFPTLFGHLDSHTDELKIDSYGVSCTTLEEVFLRVGQLYHEDHDDTAATPASVSGKISPALPSQDALLVSSTSMAAVAQSSTESAEADKNTIELKDMNMSSKKINSSPSQDLLAEVPKIKSGLFFQKFKALYVKRFINSRKDWKVGAVQLLLPVIFTILALVLASTAPALGDSAEGEPPLILEPSIYDGLATLDNHYFNTVTETANVPTSDVFIPLLTTEGFTAVDGQTDFQAYAIEQQTVDLAGFQFNQLAAVTTDDLNPTVINGTTHFSGESSHAYGIFLNSYLQTLLQVAATTAGQTASSFSMTVTNHPFPMEITEQLLTSVLSDGTGFFVAFMMLLGLAFLTGSFIIFLVNERKTGAKHVQFVSGVEPKVYWLSTFSWDCTNFIIPTLLIIICIAAFQLDAYVSANRLGVVFLLLILYHWASAPLLYLLSMVFDVPATAFSVVTVANIIIGMGTLIAVDSIRQIAAVDEDQRNLFQVSSYVVIIMYIFPNFALAIGIMDIYKNWQLQEACKIFAPEIPGLPQDLCFSTSAWETVNNQGFYFPDKYYSLQPNYLSMSSPGVGGSIIALFFEGFIFFFLLLLVEYGFFSSCCSCCRRSRAPGIQENLDKDEDVLAEHKRVSALEPDDALVVIKDLVKIYPKKGKQKAKRAVDELNFAINENECFGLLGVNGAGKSTTFKMLTGEYTPSSGSGWMKGHNIAKEVQAVRQNIGYCPQFDALIGRMTGRETLRMYGLLRGIPSNHIEKAVQNMIEMLDLTAHSERDCGTYSGGNKRKLSTAMALIGGPAIVLLDEPTSGVDPGTRRFLWDVLAGITVQGGRSVILTSHSMDECEALCTRLTIMVDGRFQCLGSVQHLKSRFGNGYSLILKKKAGLETETLKDHIQSQFPTAELKEEFFGLLNYQLPNDGEISWGTLFQMLENAKVEYDVEDYSVSQTSLEQIFLQFAGKTGSGTTREKVDLIEEDDEGN